MSFRNIDFIFRKWDDRGVVNRLHNYFDSKFLDFIDEPEILMVRDLSRPSMDVQEDKFSWDIYLRKLRKSFSSYQKLYDSAKVKPTYSWLYHKWDEETPEVDTIPPRGMRRVAHSYEDAITNKEFNSPYGTTGLLHSEYIWNRCGTVYPTLTREGRIILGIYKSRKANYRDAINRTKILFPHLSKDWETYMLPSDDVIRNVCHPFEYVRACDLTLENDYEIVLPAELSPGKQAILDERRKILPDLSVDEWFEIGSLKPVDMVVAQVMYQDVEPEFRSELLKRLRKYPNFGAIALGHDPEKWPSLFSKYRKTLRAPPPIPAEDTEIEKLNSIEIEIPTGFDSDEEFYEYESEFFEFGELVEVESVNQLDPFGDGVPEERPPAEPPPEFDEDDPFGELWLEFL
jgi:hypothetical protein